MAFTSLTTTILTGTSDSAAVLTFLFVSKRHMLLGLDNGTVRVLDLEGKNERILKASEGGFGRVMSGRMRGWQWCLLVGRIRRLVCLSWRRCKCVFLLLFPGGAFFELGRVGESWVVIEEAFVMAQVVDAELGSEVLPLVLRSAVDSVSSGLTLGQPSLRSSDLGRACIVDY
jgi:hypothetical protein